MKRVKRESKQETYAQPLLSSLLSKDIVAYVFSFLQLYLPILRLVSKEWHFYFPFSTNSPSYNLFYNLTIEIIQHDDLELWKYIKTELVCGLLIVRISAEYGRINFLKYSHENGCDWDEHTSAAAAGNGHLDCLKYLHENGCGWDEYTCANAALNGHLDCLEYLHENDCPWNSYTCAAVARNGHLDCLKYARENGCDWDEGTCYNAALNGHLDCLKWARENGCPWYSYTSAAAAGNGHLDCLKWARENGCDLC